MILMQKIEFKNLPDETTPINSVNLNTMQDNIEQGINLSESNVSKKFNGQESMGSIVVEDIRSKNLFDKNSVIENYYLSYTDGTPTWDSNMAYSDFIEVEPNIDYTMSVDTASILCIHFYDSNKNWLNYELVNDNVSTSLSKKAPATAKYVRLCFGKTKKDKVQFEKGIVATSYTNHINFDYDKNRGNCTLLFNNQVGTGNTYDLSDTLQNYRYIIFMLLLNGNAISLIYPYEALHISGYVGRVELRCCENASSLTEIIMDLAFLNDTQVICDRCGYIGHNSTEFGHNPYGLRIYGIK